MQILRLTVHRKWFDLVKSGEKKTEFRDSKPYWISRLFDRRTLKPKKFDEIHFRNGYGKRRPLVRTKHKGTRYGLATRRVEIMLGKIIKKRNSQ